jgi:alkylation response protein AidB-like acyl-CoA dehydrogenase
MRLTYDEGAESFRRTLLAWLAANPISDEYWSTARVSSSHLPDWAREWQRKLFDAGWLVPGWPPALGGRNATPVQQMVYFEELARARLPRTLNLQGLSICGPSIVDFGTLAQRERWALPTLRAETTWCLGMSEPGAGSDLASLSTRAELRDDHFLVNGQKVWTSGAHHANWCLCFVRTDPDVPKHKGISALIIDMQSPGITWRPLPELTDPGFADFNEVFFRDVVVPREHLLGPLHGGWAITRASLAHERGMLWIRNSTSIEQGVEELIELARTRDVTTDLRLRDEIASLYIDGQAAKLMGYRGFAKFARGKPSPEHALLKLFTSEVQRRVYLTGVEMLGPDALDTALPGPSTGWQAGSWAEQYLRSFAGTIAGGTSEIQRNLIAERLLGLPR